LTVTARTTTTATVLLVVLCGSPRAARADYLFTPFIGGAFARQTIFFTGVEQGEGSTHVIFGGTAGWLSSGILGFEGEFAYSPHFFERDDPLDIILGSELLTVTGNVIVAVPLNVSEYSLRPYAIGGMGLMHSGITYLQTIPPVGDNSLGFNVGAGAIGFLTARTGVRFELRHFRTFEREPNEARPLEVLPRLSFWRATVGVVIRR
jgi:hypothetical protein